MAGYDSPNSLGQKQPKNGTVLSNVAGPITPQTLLGLRRALLHLCHVWETMRSQAFGRDCSL